MSTSYKPAPGPRQQQGESWKAFQARLAAYNRERSECRKANIAAARRQFGRSYNCLTGEGSDFDYSMNG